MHMEAQAASEDERRAAAGWYEYAGGLRFYDGDKWTDHIAPPRQKVVEVNYWRIAAAVTFGMVLAWAIIWGGAQLSPEHIYWPVKFVVKELPVALR